jgi:membrane associated rhomboid family serine protease
MEMERIFENLPRKKADLILLILSSQGIIAKVDRPGSPQGAPGRFDILVPKPQAFRAAKSVDQYYRENFFLRLPKEIGPLKISSFNTPVAYVIMVLLLTIHLVSLEWGHREMILKFGASSLYIGQGETFRAVTALFLHSDGQHLLGNLAGILLFAAPLISLSGYGTGPFLLLCAGTSGNLINAYFHQNALLSIGASTAIMGAAGALAAHQMVSSKSSFQLNRLIPLFAGATLVGLFSQGENTDLSAHLFGFLAGLFWGGLFFPCSRGIYRVTASRSIELVALIIVIFILGSAIWAGL